MQGRRGQVVWEMEESLEGKSGTVSFLGPGVTLSFFDHLPVPPKKLKIVVLKSKRNTHRLMEWLKR